MTETPVDASDASAPTDGPTADVPTTCTPNTTTCSGMVLTECDGSGNPTNTACVFGCATSSDRCADLAPSNGLAGQLDQADNAGPVTLTGPVVIDTTAQTVTDNGTAVVVQSAVVTGGPVDIFVIRASSFTSGAISVRGTRALAIVAAGDVTLTGVLSVSADFQVAGPGAIVTAQPCKGAIGNHVGTGYSGGGGGGFGTAGGAGGVGGSAAGGAGGMVAGDPTLVPLRGGCGGGLFPGTEGTLPENSHPGAGGGAVQISARGTVRLTPGAFVAANGGGAKGYTGSNNIFCIIDGLCDAGSGGGSGGAILIEAGSLAIDPTGGLVANGGSGHIGLRGRASNGLVSETAAPGTVAGSVGGGDGAAGTLPARAGTGAREGGGGGGGAGRIRINLPPGSTFDPGPPIISPVPTVGAVSTR